MVNRFLLTLSVKMTSVFSCNFHWLFQLSQLGEINPALKKQTTNSSELKLTWQTVPWRKKDIHSLEISLRDSKDSKWRRATEKRSNAVKRTTTFCPSITVKPSKHSHTHQDLHTQQMDKSSDDIWCSQTQQPPIYSRNTLAPRLFMLLLGGISASAESLKQQHVGLSGRFLREKTRGAESDHAERNHRPGDCL